MNINGGHRVLFYWGQILFEWGQIFFLYGYIWGKNFFKNITNNFFSWGQLTHFPSSASAPMGDSSMFVEIVALFEIFEW